MGKVLKYVLRYVILLVLLIVAIIAFFDPEDLGLLVTGTESLFNFEIPEGTEKYLDQLWHLFEDFGLLFLSSVLSWFLYVFLKRMKRGVPEDPFIYPPYRLPQQWGTQRFSHETPADDTELQMAVVKLHQRKLSFDRQKRVLMPLLMIGVPVLVLIIYARLQEFPIYPMASLVFAAYLYFAGIEYHHTRCPRCRLGIGQHYQSYRGMDGSYQSAMIGELPTECRFCQLPINPDCSIKVTREMLRMAHAMWSMFPKWLKNKSVANWYTVLDQSESRFGLLALALLFFMLIGGMKIFDGVIYLSALTIIYVLTWKLRQAPP